MRAEWKLARAYLRRHWRQFASLSACVAVFLAAVFSLQMFFLSYNDWTQEQYYQTYGHWDSAWLYLDPEEAHTITPSAEHTGKSFVTGYVQSDRASALQQPCVGYWEGETQYLLNAELLSGALPQRPGEAAVAEDVCYLLDIPLQPGTRFTVPVTDAAGSTSERTYTLTGVLSPFRIKWTENVLVEQNENVLAQPNVITIPSEDPLITAFALQQGANLSDASFTNYEPIVNYNVSSEYRDATGPQILLWIISGVLIVVFLTLTVIGIRHAVRITLQEQRGFITRIRCAGGSRRQVCRMVLLEGLVLTVCTVAAGIAIGIGVFCATAAVLNQFTYTLRYHLYLLPFLTTAVLGIAILSATYGLFLRGAFRGAPLEAEPDRSRRRKKHARASAGNHSFIQVWRRETAPAHRGQDWVIRLTAGACMALLLFAPSYAELAIDATYGYDDLEQSRTGMDYWFGLRNGLSSGDALYQETPRYKGLTADAYQELRENPNLHIDYASIGHMSSANVVLLPGEQQSDSVQKLAQNDTFGKRIDSKNGELMESLGFPAGSDLLLYSVFGMPYEQLEQMADDRQSGALDRAAFDSGAQVAALGSDFQVGDTLTIAVTAFPATATQQEMDAGFDYGIPKITYLHATVGAVYGEGNSATSQRLLQNYPSGLILSADLMQQLDPGAGYDDVCLSLTCDPNDEEAMAGVYDSLDRAQAMSFMTFYRDFTSLNQEKADTSLEVRLPYIAMIAVFAVTIFIALLISMDLKVKSSAHSLLLMRAVGLDRRKLSRLLLMSNVLPCLEGAAGGILLGGGIGLFLTVMNGLSASSILLRTLLPNLIAGLVLLMVMAVVSYLRPRRWILSRPVIDSIENARF